MLKGVELTVGVAVCVGLEVAVGDAVDVDVGVGSNGVEAGVCVLSGVAVSVAAGSCAIAAPPSTAAYSPAQARAMAKVFLSDRITGGFLHARGPLPGGGDSAQLRHRSPRA